MKCIIVGTRKLDFVTDKKEVVKGIQLHVLKDVPKTDTSVEGRIVDKIFIRQNADGSYAADFKMPFKFGSEYNLLYDVVPGSSKPTLCSVSEVQK